MHSRIKINIKRFENAHTTAFVRFTVTASDVPDQSGFYK